MKNIKKFLLFTLVFVFSSLLFSLPVSAAETPWAVDVVNQLNAVYPAAFLADDTPVVTSAAKTLFSDTLHFNVDSYFTGGENDAITRLQLCQAAWAMSGLALPACKLPLAFSDCNDTSVGSLAAIGVINDTGGGTFTPEGTVNNAELAVVVYRTLNKMGGLKVAEKMLRDGRDSFSDVHPSDWFYDGIMYLYYNRIVQGEADGNFYPYGAITNAQLTSLLVRAQVALAGGDPLSENPVTDEFTALSTGGDTWENYSPKTYFGDFVDLGAFNTAFSQTFTGDFSDDPGHGIWVSWSIPYFWAYRNFFLAGQASSNIDPRANATRETMAYIATMLYDNYNAAEVNTSILGRFSDADEIGEAYRPAMAYLVSIGALHGDENGKLLPQATVDRAIVGVFWARVLRGLDTSKLHDYKAAVNAAVNAASGGEE